MKVTKVSSNHSKTTEQLLFDDETIYRRTANGQQELVAGGSRLSSQERRLLAMVTGFTPLRVLLDMGYGGMGLEAADVIRKLVAERLIGMEVPA